MHYKDFISLTGSTRGSSAIGSDDVISNVNISLSAQLNWEGL